MQPDFPLPRIFCPRCGSLTLDAACGRCGWQRPPAPQAVWAGAHSVTLQRGLRTAGNILATGDLLLIGGEAGDLLALDRFTLVVRDRTRLAPAGMPATVDAGAAADDRLVYVAANSPQTLGGGPATLFALHRAQLAAAAWQLATGAGQMSAPALAGDTLYFSARNGEVWAVSTEGAVRWRQPVAPGWPVTPVVTADVVIVVDGGSQLVALDRSSGKPVPHWAFRPPGDAALALPPLLLEDRLYVADAQGALHILDAAGGRRAADSYRSSGGQPFLTQPLAARSGSGWVILVGGKDHCLHAVDAEGKAFWPQPAACGGSIYSRPLVLDSTVYAATHGGSLYALRLADGRPLGDPLLLGEHVKAAPASDGLHVLVAGRLGTVWQIPHRLPPLQTPEAHLGRGEYASAVEALALAGRLTEAAQVSRDRLGNHAAAARLFGAAGDWPLALQAHLDAGELDLAEELRVRRGLRYADAAEAAARLAAGGRFAGAAALWRAADQPAAALACYLQDASIPALEAALLLSRELGDWRSEAQALAALGRPLEAAQLALHHAVAHEDATRGADAAELAARYALAFGYFTAARTPSAAESADRCRDKVRYYRRQPNLRLELLPAGTRYTLHQTGPLHVRVANVGIGVAHHLQLRLLAVTSGATGALAGTLAAELPELPGRYGEWQPVLDMQPASEGIIRIECQVAYTDGQGEPLEERRLWQVEVAGKRGSGRQVVIVQAGGQLVQSNGGEVNIVGGDLVRDSAQKGDRVTINRETVSPTAADAASGAAENGVPTCLRCGAHIPAGAAFCDMCGAKLEAR